MSERALTALTNFVNAAAVLSEAWDPDILDDGYPAGITLSFDELVQELYEWQGKAILAATPTNPS